MEPRSEGPIGAAVEVLGDRWSLLILRDVIFGDRRYFRALLTGSTEGIASNILADRLVRLVDAGILARGTAAAGAARSLQPHGSRHPDPPDHLLPSATGLSTGGPAATSSGAGSSSIRDEGPAFIEELMDELRARHLGAPPKPHDGPGPFERLDAVYAAAVEQENRLRG